MNEYSLAKVQNIIESSKSFPSARLARPKTLEETNNLYTFASAALGMTAVEPSFWMSGAVSSATYRKDWR
jgi:hypothetical protein